MTDGAAPPRATIASGGRGVAPSGTDGRAMDQRKRVTRVDVARLAGVSLPVVSYALNGGPKNVSAATRARVLDAVDRLGYRPNAAARALRRGRSELLGFVVPNVANPLFATFAREVELAAAARGVTVIVLSAPAGEVHVAIDRLAAHQVDGILVATRMQASDIAALERAALPAVLLNQPAAIAGIPTFGVDLYGGARAAVEHLVERGHARIAYLGPDDADSRRLQGWRDVLTAHGLASGPVIDTEFSRSGGFAAAARLLASYPDVTALFASSDQIAVGAVLALHQHGVTIPAQMAIVSFDDSPDAEYAWPPLTAVRQPTDRMAAAAVARLLDADGPEHVRFPVELIVRASTTS